MVWLVWALFGGLALAGVLSALVFRVHSEWAWMRPRKTCLVCEVPRKGLDLVPFFGDALMRGRCRACHASIAWGYVVIECIVVLLVVFHVWRYVTGTWIPADVHTVWLWAARDIVASIFLLIVFVYDLRYQLILDRYSIPGVVALFALNILIGKSGYELALAMVILLVFFLLQHALSGGRLLGAGDVRMGLLIGAMLGFTDGILAVLLAYVLGALVGTGLLATGRCTLRDRVPFGTFLAVASFVMLVWGDRVQVWLF